ncbi:hypothetical protein TorRG33x02_007260 [Trema orientale]|uniref:Uncharacterized protein n=1 Tax=Trema orientale TaxID=63057 RepID=A0A2P5G0G6_TREOI|nr:hypothetical protein TorRG33x02_007260 [Trema orientale]
MILHQCTAGQMLFAAAERQRCVQMAFFPDLFACGPHSENGDDVAWADVNALLAVQGNLLDQEPRGGSASGL